MKTNTFKLNKLFSLVLLSILVLAPSGCDPQKSADDEDPKIDAPDGWVLVWNDEFSGPNIDPAKWRHEINANGGGNNELQYYTQRSKNSRIEDGVLIIESHEETYSDVEGARDYTSARLRTKGRGDWKYGRFEVRAKLPTGQGLWPAIWMLPTDWEYGGWPKSGEIDIMEVIGSEPDLLHGTLHFGNTWTDKSQDGGSLRLSTGSLHNDFHVYTVEWTETEFNWYIDDVQFARVSNWYTPGHDYPSPFDKRFHILLNVAVGGNWPGSPDATTTFPQRMEVDYVRVFESESGQ